MPQIASLLAALALLRGCTLGLCLAHVRGRRARREHQLARDSPRSYHGGLATLSTAPSSLSVPGVPRFTQYTALPASATERG
jgi:hypothetical protein